MWREPLTGNTGENSESHKPIICGKSPMPHSALYKAKKPPWNFARAGSFFED
jgi:hypothetical protein